MDHKNICSCKTDFKLSKVEKKFLRIKRTWWMKCIPSSRLYKCRSCHGKYLVIHFMNIVITYRKGLVNFRECFSVRDFKV